MFRRYRDFVMKKISGNDDSPFEKVVGGAILGTNEFVDDVKEKYINSIRDTMKNVQAIKAFDETRTAEDVIRIADAMLHTDSKTKRTVQIYLCREYTNASLREIGELFGISPSAVSVAARRMKIRLTGGSRYQELLGQLNGIVSVL